MQTMSRPQALQITRTPGRMSAKPRCRRFALCVCVFFRFLRSFVLPSTRRTFQPFVCPHAWTFLRAGMVSWQRPRSACLTAGRAVIVKLHRAHRFTCGAHRLGCVRGRCITRCRPPPRCSGMKVRSTFAVLREVNENGREKNLDEW